MLATAAVAILDNNGRQRAFLTPCEHGSKWFHVYAANGTYFGAGMNLQAAINMAKEKTGIAHEELPSVRRSDIRIVKGEPQKIVGFQGGGFYRHDHVFLGETHLGSFFTKEQPARNVHKSMTCYGSYGVTGHNLSWLVAQNGYRIEEVDGDYLKVS